MGTVSVTIDGRAVTVPEGSTIMEAADRAGIHIPRLCHHPELGTEGACRVCVVEVEGVRNLVASCAFPAMPRMNVRTSTPELRRIRRDIVELLLDSHPMDCQTCERNGNCELQHLAYVTGVRERLFEGERKHHDRDLSSPALVRDPEKCVLCHRCVRLCRDVQQMGVLGYFGKGFATVVMPAFDAPLDETPCVACGQCAAVCPTGALVENSHAERVLCALADGSRQMVVQVSPAAVAAIGEGFGMAAGTAQAGRTVAALKRLGFDVVHNEALHTHLMVMERAAELVRRLKGNEPLPLVGLCTPALARLVWSQFPELVPSLSTCDSPMGIHAALAKTVYAERQGRGPDGVYCVQATSCTARKLEAELNRPSGSERPCVDAVLTTRELVWMIKSAGICFEQLDEKEFDHPLGESKEAEWFPIEPEESAEAVVRASLWMLTGRGPTAVESAPVQEPGGVSIIAAEANGARLRCAVASGLGAAQKLLESVRSGAADVQYVEIASCPGGCLSGGGQPYAAPGTAQQRARAIAELRGGRQPHLPHENPHVRRLYDGFLGRPLGEKSHELLHMRLGEGEAGRPPK